MARRKDSERKRKPRGLQWDLDRELEEKEVINNPKKVINNFEDGEAVGGEGYINKNILGSKNNVSPLNPPDPPFPPHVDSEEGELSTIVKEVINNLPLRPCLYEHPATREKIRSKLKELGVTNVNQLIRTRTAPDLLEAISDYQRAWKAGVRILNPTGYLNSLLK